ncbi:MAG: hypothetical protein AB8G86_04165 [Saprospiraceae bacterium]
MKKQPIDRPLSFLPIFAEALNGDLTTAQDQYEVLLPAKDRPSVLDDEIINRIIKLHEEKNEFIENYDRQFKLWRQEKLTPGQLALLQDLEAKLPLLKAVNDKVLKLAYEIQPHTIDKILAMDPMDLALGHLSGKIKSPMPPPPKPIARFLVFTDEQCQAEDLQLTFLFKAKGTDLEMNALISAFFQKLEERFHDFQRYGAKRMMGFFKNFVEFEDMEYITGAMDFTEAQLRTEGLRLQTDAYMRIWCDRFDEAGYPLLETISFAEPEVAEKPTPNPVGLPILTVNKLFMRTLLSSSPPCAALGYIEETGVKIGFLAMRPERTIPEAVLAKGFNFGHALIGTSDYTIIQFGFEFYGFGTYYVLLNPNKPLVQTVLTTMIESGSYFFLAMNPDKSVSTYKADIGQENLAGLRDNFPKIQAATTTDEQYNKGLHHFHKAPDTEGKLLNWVCRDTMDFLDLSKAENRLDLNPR